MLQRYYFHIVTKSDFHLKCILHNKIIFGINVKLTQTIFGWWKHHNICLRL